MLSRISRRITSRLAPPPLRRPAAVYHLNASRRRYAVATGKRPVDEKVDDLSELYASAKDEVCERTLLIMSFDGVWLASQGFYSPSILHLLSKCYVYITITDKADVVPMVLSHALQFEIAVEETAKKTIYARDDRETAREELQKFKSAYEEAIATSSPEESEEIKRRVGQRLRELDNAVETLNEADNEEH
ncbi:hypothetical protein Dda_3127 [Drechslerella dactyloides]|uniref:Uncharacterized protein n=1 Tax=Drechslerella dactyloides TaxID=74499 RepID=A0AAD6J350_DREDA|nr:hypothetical protein Dda_3127 [Drechslerella dactyloides]